MTEHKLFKLTGEIMGLGPAESSPQRTYYKYIWIRESNDRHTTLQSVSAGQELTRLIAVGNTVTLYVVPSPSGLNCLFGIDSGSDHADAVEPIARDQAKAYRSAVKWLLISIPLCLVLVGFLLLVLTIRGLILLSKAPKPKDMYAFLAASRAAA